MKATALQCTVILTVLAHLGFTSLSSSAAENAIVPGKPQQLTSPDQVPEGLARSDWQSIRAAYEAGRHEFKPIEGGWQARNPGQQWTTKFDKRGFLATPKEGEWTWGLELKSYGFGSAQRVITATPAVCAVGQRLSYQWDDTVQEWFVNDQRGLEHGFTVNQRPADSTEDTSLSFVIATRGSLRPVVSIDARGVLFQDIAGTTVLNYSSLKVWDADGRILNSRFEAVGDNAVRLLVHERGARYPITIDPIAQQAYLKAGNNGGPTSDSFGCSVAVSGDTVVVGAYQEDSSSTGVDSTPSETAANSGAAYVFVRSGVTWSQQAYLKASNTGLNDQFGWSVAVSDDTVVVGAWGEDSSNSGVNSTPNEIGFDSGAAYVFVRNGTNWSQQAYLKASNSGSGDEFGKSVSVSSDTVVVGAYKEASSSTGVNSTPNDTASSAGAAYVFVRSGVTWSQHAYLKASNTGSGDEFGKSVSVSGDTMVVGANGEDSGSTGANSTPNENASGSGAAYVFVRSGTTWSQHAYLKASNTGANDNFGFSVSVSDDTVVVGANGEDSSSIGVNSTPNENAADSGSAYVFVRSGTTWSQHAYLKASNTGAGDEFGRSVSVAGDTVLVGANGEDSGSTGVNSTPNENASGAGAAYIFVRSGTSWGQQSYLKSFNTDSNDQFGLSVSVSGDTVVVGANGEDSSSSGVNSTPNESAASAGAAYVFVRNDTSWSQQVYLKASNTPLGVGSDDRFGLSVSVSGDTVVVGAHLEDSSGMGVNSASNESASGSGAAYVFVRNGTSWSQQAYLKASNTGANDNFGFSVSVSDDTVVVGARWENSSSTGVNSTPNDDASSAGAAYVFVRNGTNWSQQAYLKASNTGTGDFFGISVSVSGDTVVVGAYGEGSNSTGVNSTPNENASGSGAAYVFVRSGTSWSQQAYLKAANTGGHDNFGYSVSVSDDTVVVGAYQEDSSSSGVNSTPNESAISAGAAYVFLRNGTNWSQQAYLKASNPGADDRFGMSVSVSGDTVVVGALLEDSSGMGVNSMPDESADGSGAAYVFVRSGTGWSQQAFLKASNTTLQDGFGHSVAVSGDTVVVGAPWESSSSAGVNSTPDEVVSGSGAAYLFTGLGLSEIAVFAPSGTPVANGSGTLNFEARVIGQQFGERMITIRNDGITPLENIVATISGADASEFSVVGAPTFALITDAASNLLIRFSPTSVGPKAAVLTIASNDPNDNPFTISLSGLGITPFQGWLNSQDVTGGANGNDDGDGLNNLLEYAFGTNPRAPQLTLALEADGDVVGRGIPTLQVVTTSSNTDYRGIFGRRVDRAASGLTYTTQFSHDLVTWFNSTENPEVLASDNEIEIVSVRFPLHLPDGTQAHFFRVNVSIP